MLEKYLSWKKSQVRSFKLGALRNEDLSILKVIMFYTYCYIVSSKSYDDDLQCGVFMTNKDIMSNQNDDLVYALLRHVQHS